MDEGDGQLHTLGLLEELREQCKALWGTSSELYFRVDRLLSQLANPNLHDIPTNLAIHVELWDRYDKHIRCIAATSSILIGNAAYDLRLALSWLEIGIRLEPRAIDLCDIANYNPHGPRLIGLSREPRQVEVTRDGRGVIVPLTELRRK